MVNPLVGYKGFIFTLYLVFFLHFTYVRNTASDDEKWISLYGNDSLTSGVWEYLRTIKNDEDKMRNISIQAHHQCFHLEANIVWVNSSVKELHFPDYADFRPIKVDVLMYTVEGRYLYEAPDLPYYFYLTKGMKPDCVYYLIPPEPLDFEVLNLVADHLYDPEESGIWPRAQDICYDINKLKNISAQIHRKVFNRKEQVTTAIVTRRELRFNSSTQHKPINITIVRYTIFQLIICPEEKLNLYHFTKGLQPDSVHYLKPEEGAADDQILYIDQLVCGIDLDPKTETVL